MDTFSGKSICQKLHVSKQSCINERKGWWRGRICLLTTNNHKKFWKEEQRGLSSNDLYCLRSQHLQACLRASCVRNICRSLLLCRWHRDGWPGYNEPVSVSLMCIWSSRQERQTLNFVSSPSRKRKRKKGERQRWGAGGLRKTGTFRFVFPATHNLYYGRAKKSVSLSVISLKNSGRYNYSIT